MSQLAVPLANLNSMSFVVWFSRPNKPIVLSFSIVHVSMVTIKLSIGVSTTPNEVLSDSSASRPDAPVAIL